MFYIVNSIIFFKHLITFIVIFFYRKLVENSKIDGQESNNDDEANDNKLLDVQNEKERHNSTYYVSEFYF